MSGLDGKACWMDLGVKPKAAAGHDVAEGASVLLDCRNKTFLYYSSRSQCPMAKQEVHVVNEDVL
jgi:hypothetical protein